jgi:hypothetical protein
MPLKYASNDANSIARQPDHSCLYSRLGTLRPSGWLRRVLRSIVLSPTTLMVLLDPEFPGSSAIRPQVVGDQSIGNETAFLQQLAHEL